MPPQWALRAKGGVSSRSAKDPSSPKRHLASFQRRYLGSLCHAPSIGGADGIECAGCLSAPQAGEFPRTPSVAATRREVRSTA